MQKLLLILVGLGVSAGPAFAQSTQPAAQPAPSQDVTAQQQQAPKTITKLVCRAVHEEPLPGSMVGSTSKVCRKLQVAAPTGPQNVQPQDSAGR